jgi:tetratricopeptide (TPR) repeat protein
MPDAASTCFARVRSKVEQGADEAIEGMQMTRGDDVRRDYLSRSVSHFATKDFTAAERLLVEAIESFPEDAQFWELLARTRWNLDKKDTAMAAIDRAFALAPNERFATYKAWMYCQQDRLEDARITLLSAIERFPDQFSPYIMLSEVYQVLERWSDAVEIAERGTIALPKSLESRECWISALFAADRLSETIAAIEETAENIRDLPEQMGYRLLMLKARAHQELWQSDQAIETLSTVLESRPSDEEALEQMSLILDLSRKREDARGRRAELQKIQAEKLPDRLKDALAELWNRLDDVDIDDAALGWAWEVADKSIWEETSWRRAAIWGKEARLLIRRWWEAAPPDKVKQIDDILDHRAFGEFRSALVETGRCFLATGHVGPTQAVFHVLQRGNQPARFLGTAIRDRAYGETIIPILPGPIVTMRNVINELHLGSTIGMLCDASAERDNLALEFLGRSISISTYTPKLILRTGGTSLWFRPLWRNGQITVEFAPLPNPIEKEPLEDWTRRWIDAYLAKLEKAMRGSPENLGLFSGIWGNVNRGVLRQRQVREARRELGKL